MTAQESPAKLALSASEIRVLGVLTDELQDMRQISIASNRTNVAVRRALTSLISIGFAEAQGRKWAVTPQGRARTGQEKP